MARWRLRAGHYLNVPGTEWEYKETDQASGRQGRKVFEVPLYLHPDIVTDQNYDGNVVVCDGNKCMPRDYVFTGPPTPDMEPMDVEAQAITDQHKAKWIHPIDSLDGTFGDALIRIFSQQMPQQAPITAGPSVSAKEFEELKAMVAELQKQNTELKASQGAKRRY